MTEDVKKYMVFPSFTTPVSGTLREALEKYTTTRDKIYLNGLVMTKGKYGIVSMIPKTVMVVAQDCTVSDHGPPIPQIYLNPQDIMIVTGPGMKPAPKFFSWITKKRKLGRTPPPSRCIDREIF